VQVRNATLVIASVLTFATAACGGSDDSSDSDSATAPDATTASEASGDVEEAEDDASGDGSNDDAQENLDEAGVDLDLEELEETVGGFSTGEGGGVVTINGIAYTFEAEICVDQAPDFVAAGPGASDDGTPAWVDVSLGDESDGESTVTVEVGKTELFGSGGDDQPDFYAGNFGDFNDFTFTLEGGQASGSGEIQDYNGVAVAFGERLPFTFEAVCA
jgi:hypothetical protein